MMENEKLLVLYFVRGWEIGPVKGGEGHCCEISWVEGGGMVAVHSPDVFFQCHQTSAAGGGVKQNLFPHKFTNGVNLEL